MDRNLSRTNIRDGLILGLLVVFMLGVTFAAAYLYLA